MGQGCTVALAVKVKVTCWDQGINITVTDRQTDGQTELL